MALVGVPGRDDEAAMQAFVDEFGLQDMPHAVDADGSLWARFGVSYQPAWVFIDSEGRGDLHAGALGAEGLERRLAALAGS